MTSSQDAILNDENPDQIVRALISELRLEAGRSGTEEILKKLREIDVYALEPVVEYPMPMFFADAWRELLDALIKEAEKE